MADIGTLTLNIESKSRGALSSLEALRDQLKALNGELASTASTTGKAAKQMGEFQRATSGAGEGAKKASGGLGKFFKSIVRIAGYRAIRSTLRSITEGFKEGFNNITEYSKALNNLDASGVSGNRNSISASLLQMKNTLATAIAPALQALEPIIVRVINWFTIAIDKVAQFFAALNGQKTYTKAVYTTEGIADNVSKASASAKELKRTLLGFDQINALNSSSNGGGGGSSSAVDYTKMFEEAENPLYKYKELFETIKDIAIDVGIIIAGWALSQSLASSLGLLFGSSVGAKAGQITLGITLAIVGIKLGYEAGVAAANGDITGAIIKSVVGSLAAAAGGALIGFAIGGPAGAAIGAIIGVGIELVVQTVGIADASSEIRAKAAIEKVLSRYGMTVESMSPEAVEARYNVSATLMVSIDDIKQKTDETMLSLEYARELVDGIFAYDGNKNLTSEQIADINTKCQLLNRLNLDGIKIEWDEVTGKIKTSKDEIYNSMDAFEKYIKMQALQEIAIEAYKAKTKAVQRYTEAANEMFLAEELALTAQANGNMELAKQYAETESKLREEMVVLKDTIGSADKAYSEAVASIKAQNDGVFNNTKETADKIAGVFGDAGKKGAKNFSDWFNKNVHINPIDFVFEAGDVHSVAGGVHGRLMQKAQGGYVGNGNIFLAGENGVELINSQAGGASVSNSNQLEDIFARAMGRVNNDGGNWTIVVQDENGNIRSQQVITAAERRNRRDGRTVISVGV